MHVTDQIAALYRAKTPEALRAEYAQAQQRFAASPQSLAALDKAKDHAGERFREAA